MVVVRRVAVRSLISATKLGADFVINPYVGCPHNCIYCYARCIMLMRSPHAEEWGDYLDVKVPSQPLPLDKLFRKSVLFSSMTDAYNPYEERAEITRSLLKELLPAECRALGVGHGRRVAGCGTAGTRRLDALARQ